MNTRSGQLRTPLFVFHDTSPEGEEIPTWTAYDDMNDWPCDVRDVSGQESFRGQQIESTTTHAITTRYDSRFTPGVLLYDALTSTRYEVVSVIDRTGRKRELFIQATTVENTT